MLGEVTEQLVDRLPGGRVFAVDASACHDRLAHRAPRRARHLLVSDLLELEAPSRFDAISDGDVHWMRRPRPPVLAPCTRTAPGLASASGGAATCAERRRMRTQPPTQTLAATEPFAAHLAASTLELPEPAQTEERLRRAASSRPAGRSRRQLDTPDPRGFARSTSSSPSRPSAQPPSRGVPRRHDGPPSFPAHVREHRRRRLTRRRRRVVRWAARVAYQQRSGGGSCVGGST